MATNHSTNKGNFIHGFRGTPEYWAYTHMRSRCYSPKYYAFHRYGGRGIKMCDRWFHGEDGKLGLVCFIEDMGKRPSDEHSLDRIDNDGNYEPKNCRWATRYEQGANTSKTRLITANGRTQSFCAWARELGIHQTSLRGRIQRGMSPEEAVLMPKTPINARKNARYITARGQTKNIADWAREIGISGTSLGSRLDKGLSGEDALYLVKKRK